MSHSTSPSRIDIRNLTITLGKGDNRFNAIEHLTLSVKPGEFICLLGPSGCGKSTILGALAGHLSTSNGDIKVDNTMVSGPSPDRGLVFQQHTLLPWRKVEDNVGFSLKMRGVGPKERKEAVGRLLKLVGLSGFEQHWPSQLSGGMQQRVELARVLISHPRLLLMDEPFAALDALCRVEMQSLLLSIWSKIPTTIVFVTHDIDEAIFLADRILVMSPRPGKIIENIAVTLPRPRSNELVTSPAFMQIKRHCLALLNHQHGETLPRLSPISQPHYSADTLRFI